MNRTTTPPCADNSTMKEANRMNAQHTKTSRRRFLKNLGAGALAAALAGTHHAAHAAAEPVVSGWGILIDLTRCTGCESCVLACKQANRRPNPDQVPTQLCSEAYSFLDAHTVLNADGNLETQKVKRQCMHCLQPACVAACTVGALRRQSNGAVTYDASKCFGCRYCQYACPFGIPTYDWDNPLGLIHKCEMCAHRLEEGQLPACVGACPNGAIRFGPRAALIAQAHAQIESNPFRYVDHVYGEYEVGGTSVLYLSAVPFQALGFPMLGDTPIAGDANQIMERTPLIAAGVAAIATSLYWLTKRHHELATRRVAIEPDQPPATTRRAESQGETEA